jgi:type IV pilus assembly protein PilP
MRRVLCITAGVALLGALGACSPDNDELIQWMEPQHKEVRPNVPPVYPPKKFDPQAYVGVSGVEPFGQQKLVAQSAEPSQHSSALLSAAKNHVPEELESYPLDSMSMVGSLRQGGKTHALLLVEGKLRDVTVGNHIGQNYGEIKSISDSEVTVVETVQDATGEWVQRTSTLQMQEKAR